MANFSSVQVRKATPDEQALATRMEEAHDKAVAAEEGAQAASADAASTVQQAKGVDGVAASINVSEDELTLIDGSTVTAAEALGEVWLVVDERRYYQSDGTTFAESSIALPGLSSEGELSDVPVARASTIAAMQGTTPTPNMHRLVEGYAAAGDPGGGLFRWVPGDTTPADGGTVFESTVSGYGPGEANEGRWHRLEAAPFRPEWWGAKGDGVADDTAAVQAAIDAAPDGAEVVFSGHHIISSIKVEGRTDLHLSCIDGGRIQAADWTNQLGEGGEADPDDLPLMVLESEGITFDSMTILGKEGEASGTDHEMLAFIRGSSRITFQGCIVGSIGGYGFRSYDTEWLQFNGCYMSRASVWAVNSPALSVIGCRFSNTKFDAIKTTSDTEDVYTDKVIISGNQFIGGANDAIDTFTRGAELIIKGNYIEDMVENGIQIKTIMRDTDASGNSGTMGYTRRIIVQGNILMRDPAQADASNFGIKVTNGDERSSPQWDLADAPRWVQVKDNLISGYTRGVHMDAIQYISVTGNHIKDAGENGIQCNRKANHLRIADNMIANASSTAILLAGDSASDLNNVTVSGNHISGAPTGISFRGSHSIVEGNLVEGCGTYGITCFSSTNTSFQNNRVRDCTNGSSDAAGLRINGLLRMTVVGNIVRDSDIGYVLEGSVNGSVFSNNIAENNGTNFDDTSLSDDDRLLIQGAGNLQTRDDVLTPIGFDALPAASETYRGRLARVVGGAGVADELHICIKDAADAYTWSQIV